MSKGIKNVTGMTPAAVVKRRLAQPESNRGLGYWAAKDATRRIKEEAERGKRVDN